ncbi:DUF222 domain-containing protein [Gordonia sp. zg691]|uniref:DUF222 domain-containing protein n=1 Tax=Gordonia jinghuaiqii TaxID=2758710 RepID=A0A7D7LQ34_9ACTN|nr:HNH endonuclease signature motif containing protein [Gordonia jinghuaiqii]MBD0859625.1 DUF222 domain-containing protein [Gordonia jinghuaiqii]MCR5976852.1 DUF222 domain-containing protein [Gordonia jinghuaiqii]QMT00520.1 DUF222 domain-containing protein [Gordonia jinghuaiqii]
MQSETGDTNPEGNAPEGEYVLPAPVADAQLSATELIDVATHCASITSAAAYRLLTAASLLHQDREEEYLLRRSETHTGEAESAEALHRQSADVAAGIDPYAEFGPNGFDQATAELGAALTITAAEARELIRTGDALRYRLLFTGNTLALGRIDQRRFLIALKRTDFVDEATMVKVDAHLAEAILARPPMSTTRFTALVDSIVQKHAPDAVRRRRERAADDRKVTLGPDRFQPGQSRITGSLPAADAAALDAQLTAMAKGVHATDARTMPQRRADSLVALASGTRTLPCHCPECAPEPEATDLDADVQAETPAPQAPEPQAPAPQAPEAAVVEEPTRTEEPAVTAESLPCDHSGPRPTFHIVVNLSTLLGLDDDPGVLDGHGLIDADSMRRLLADARRSFIGGGTTLAHHTDAADTGVADRYAPSRKLQALARSGELCCTFPGCNQPVWTTDLDHTFPFDHADPRRGGETTDRNLKPLCRFHHRIKTFGMWRDYQDEYMAAWFQSPTGHTFLGNAFNGRDLFGYLVPQKPPDHPARSHLATMRTGMVETDRRKVDRWNKAHPPPF